MSDPRYHTTRWRRKRAHQLTVEPCCRLCRALGIVKAATVADHVIPHRGDETLFWQGELQSLCATCHSSHKQSVEHGEPLAGCSADGVPFARGAD